MVLRSFIAALASLRLTVTLLALLMILIFAGTLAQANVGIWQAIDNYFRGPVAWIDLQLFVPRALATVPIAIPFPGGATLALLLIVNLLAAHVSTFALTWRRAGTLVLHAGLIVLLVGELLTGTLSSEGMITIDEGGSSSYIEDQREVELAIVEKTGRSVDAVTAIAGSRLRDAAADRTTLVRADRLPFAVRVDRWMPNSVLQKANASSSATQRSDVIETSNAGPVATHGAGLDLDARAVPPVPGVEASRVDAPSAYLTLMRDNGESAGTWLVSLNLVKPQPVDVDGRQFEIAIRFKRTYKPYTLHLIDFRHDKFVGTEVARNFSSRVRLVDAARGTDREVDISMNNPLRHAGETFYQASFKPDDSGTILLVVRNPSWWVPYVACALVTGGMLFHFARALIGFFRRHRKTSAAKASAGSSTGELSPTSAPTPTQTRGPAAWLPWAAAVAGVMIAIGGLIGNAGSNGDGFETSRFARLPVSSHGRIKPIDTVARNALMLAGGRQSVQTQHGRVAATDFLLDLMARPEVAKDYPIVRVDHPDLLTLLERTSTDRGRLTLAQLEPHWAKVSEQAMRASQLSTRERDPFQKAVLELFEKVNHLLELSRMQAPYAIPPLAAGETWRPFHEAFMASQQQGGGDASMAMHPAVQHVVAVMTAYHEHSPQQFNQAVLAYEELIQRALPGEGFKARMEVWFNRIAPFYGATIVYVIAFVLGCVALLLKGRSNGQSGGRAFDSLRSAGLGLLVGALIVHTLAIVLRSYLQGRPPVTNLYSSAIFVGWACVVLAVFIERLYPWAIALIGASVTGAATLIIAHNLGNDGDTMQMMQAVLDSNFWLATHVITVSLGYSATFLAGLLAVMYVVLGFFTAYLTRERAQGLVRMIYGVACFALLFSFVGTVLGGIWADQSWGRFWGWDPKENGAALVVLINAILLHARWGGLVRDRGIVLLAIGGNIVTAWSWFGTNMLGIGLHAYGFMDSAVFWLLAFVVSQFLLIGLGLLPRRAWQSGNVS